MRSKLAMGGLAVAIGFLLVTNPVVADAAKQITGKQIKNNSVTTKDIKNNNLKGQDIKDGSLTASDLAAGTVPPEITQLKRFLSSGFTALTGTLAFVGNQATVTVDGNDVIVANGSLLVFGNTTGDDFNYGLCYRTVGSAATPTVLGGNTALFTDVDVMNGDNSNSMTASDTLPAGSYTVGFCAQLSTGAVSYERVSGTVQVFSGSTGGLSRASAGRARPSNLP
jgi:hypothetical protein